MMLLSITEIISGAASILLALFLILLIFKVTKGILKGIISVVALFLIVNAILAFVGVY